MSRRLLSGFSKAVLNVKMMSIRGLAVTRNPLKIMQDTVSPKADPTIKIQVINLFMTISLYLTNKTKKK